MSHTVDTTIRLAVHIIENVTVVVYDLTEIIECLCLQILLLHELLCILMDMTIVLLVEGHRVVWPVVVHVVQCDVVWIRCRGRSQ